VTFFVQKGPEKSKTKSARYDSSCYCSDHHFHSPQALKSHCKYSKRPECTRYWMPINDPIVSWLVNIWWLIFLCCLVTWMK